LFAKSAPRLISHRQLLPRPFKAEKTEQVLLAAVKVDGVQVNINSPAEIPIETGLGNTVARYRENIDPYSPVDPPELGFCQFEFCGN
jgi:hypothetical protein